jgi:cellulose synthase operon protein C
MLVLATVPAHALVWPDVPERVERGLASSDPASRRLAARDLAALGSARAAPLLAKALSDPDIEVRIAAAQSAIRLRVPAAVDLVLPWLGERDARLRASACEVVHALPDPRTVQPLSRALSDSDATVRSMCADALGASGSPEAVAPLSGKLDDGTPNVRVQVARALAHLGDARAVVPLVGKVQDSVPEVRQAVVRALGELGDARAVQALLLALRDNVPEVRVEALGALGRLRAPEAVDAMAPLAIDRHPNVRQAAVVALGRIGTPNAVRALVRALGTQEDASATVERTPVREALVASGKAAVPELIAVFERPASPAVAASAAWVLGELRATESAPVLVAALRKGALPPAAALHGLAGVGTQAEVPVVLEYVADPAPATREAALRAATALLDPTRPDGRAVEPLAATLKNPRTSPRERAAVATLLGRTGAPRAAGELVGLVRAKDSTLRLAAIDALGALGAAPGSENAAVDDALVPLLGDADPAVRLHASTALASTGGKKARGALIAKLGGGEELDRFALFAALGGILERHPDDAAVRRVARELGVAAGPERDAVIEAIGRARVPAAIAALSDVAKSSDPNDRRSVASLVAGHPHQPQALALAERLSNDPDTSVRAEATFALGALADASAAPKLAARTRGDVETATNAVAAIARIGQRHSSVNVPCELLADARPTVRANALAALALAKRRCADGRAERKLLAEDTSELVRASAARALIAAPLPEDKGALERCAMSDRSADAARACRPRPPRPSSTSAVTVFVVGEGSTGAKPRAPFLLEYADGVLRAGVADRRGATFDPVAPTGDVTLRRMP